MAVGNVSRFETRMQNARAGIRVNSRVPVAVEWAESGCAMRAEGYTVDTSTKGCLAMIPRSFPIGERLLLVNLMNGNACEAILVWRGHESRTGWELGLELQEAPMEFWGVEF